ncbi:MAG: hypothetical protein HPM95_06255 [Alphaproteobacteria bacterium]|nr:hypothetical protein [Alphaproteobacteria bacterium]
MKRLSGRHPRHAARTAFRATVALVALSLTVGMARADFVVLAASGASGALQPGARLADDATLTLPDGAKVTLMSRDGRMLTLEGAYSGPLNEPLEAPATAKGNDGALQKLSRL